MQSQLTYFEKSLNVTLKKKKFLLIITIKKIFFNK